MQKIVEKIKNKGTIEENLDLKYVDLENMFDAFLTDQNNYIYNLNETLYLYISNSRLKIFRPDHEMPWTLVSFKLYNSTRLAWLLIRLNNVPLKNVFKLVKPGDPVYYLAEDDVETIMRTLING